MYDVAVFDWLFNIEVTVKIKIKLLSSGFKFHHGRISAVRVGLRVLQAAYLVTKAISEKTFVRRLV